jgi:DNA-binding NarL/FixJ family response regulator
MHATHSAQTNAHAQTAHVIGVVVVEDDPHFLAAFVRAVHAAPDARLVATAESRSQALALLGESAPDVLLVDIGLPDGSGIDVIAAAHKAWPHCGLMVTTTFADEAHVMQSIEAGAAGYLLKDSSPHNIMSEIRSLHEGGSPISPLIARCVLRRLRPDAPSVGASLAKDSVSLSPRETQVLQYVTKGFSYDEIARLMDISRHTVLTFVRRIYAKLEVNTQMEAVRQARASGLLL